jgi:hypothetical protein
MFAGPEIIEERLHLCRLPLPRVLIRELDEPANEVDALFHRRCLQEPRPLLQCPTIEHAAQHSFRRIEEDNSSRQRFLRVSAEPITATLV